MKKLAHFRTRIDELAVRCESDVEQLLLREYGSMFVVNGAETPPFIVFPDETAVDEFQANVPKKSGKIGGLEFTLQENAMMELLSACDEAGNLGLSITPRGPESGSRSYSDTVTLWASRVEPALRHWLEQGRISIAQANQILSSAPFDQVPLVLELEEKGIFFAKDRSKTILYSVAPPGTSQHLAMLAFDVSEFDDPQVREVLSRHGWFQTVTSDLPHFTYLGAKEAELTGLGLKRVEHSDRHFWVPEL